MYTCMWVYARAHPCKHKPSEEEERVTEKKSNDKEEAGSRMG